MDGIFDENGMAITDVSITVYGYDSMFALIGPYTANLVAGMGLPLNATDVAPPVFNEGVIAVFDPQGKAWSLSEDHRGETVYDKSTQLPSKVTYLGPYRSGVTPIKPGSAFDSWNEVTGNWDQSESQIAAKKAAALAMKMISEIDRAGEMISITEDKLELSYFNPGETEESLTASLKQWELYRLNCNSFQKGYTTVQPYAPDSEEFAAQQAAAAAAAADAQRQADLAAAQKAEEEAAAQKAAADAQAAAEQQAAADKAAADKAAADKAAADQAAADKAAADKAAADKAAADSNTTPASK